MSDVSVTPPAANVWDVADIATQALAVLRMDTNDVDAARVNTAAKVVTTGPIDHFLDYATPINATAVPSLVQGAVELTIEEYKRPGVAWGILDAWSADTVPVRISSDRLRSVRSLIIPYKARFSVG